MGVSKHIRSGDVYSVGPEYKILWMSRSRLRVLWGLSTGGPWMHIKQYGTSLKKKWDKTIWNKFEKETNEIYLSDLCFRDDCRHTEILGRQNEFPQLDFLKGCPRERNEVLN